MINTALNIYYFITCLQGRLKYLTWYLRFWNKIGVIFKILWILERKYSRPKNILPAARRLGTIALDGKNQSTQSKRAKKYDEKNFIQ